MRKPWGIPCISIEVGGITLDAQIDTAFEGCLQLPDRIKATLKPFYVNDTTFQSPLGIIVTTGNYIVSLRFDGLDLNTLAIFLPDDAVLIGADLLADFRLAIDFPAGTVALDYTGPWYAYGEQTPCGAW